VTTAIANAEAGIAVRAAADEQGALRRVATLVASSAATSEVFSTVTEEIARVLGADATLLARADSDGAVVVGTWARDTAVPPLGTRIPLGGTNLTTLVLETGRSARVERYEAATGDGAEVARTYGLRSAVGAPILVEGRLWGLVIAGTTRDESFQADAEQRLVAFTELVATAVANATARDELLASRARIVAAGDEARRQIQRNLHDGTQQRLVSLGFAVRAAEADIPPEQDDLRVQLSAVATGLGAAIEDLQEISRGIHPAILAKGGLGTALKSLARRSPIPVELDISADERIAEPIELAAYYVASEVLANAAKHSQATRIDVSVEQQGHSLVLSIDDDGVGGADVQTGSGLVGLADRVAALGGSIRVTRAPGDGTHVVARLPLEGEPVPEAEQRVG
jgi:signal transduction histidine kinase